MPLFKAVYVSTKDVLSDSPRTVSEMSSKAGFGLGGDGCSLDSPGVLESPA